MNRPRAKNRTGAQKIKTGTAAKAKLLWLIVAMAPLVGCQTLGLSSDDANPAVETAAVTKDPALQPTPSRRQSARTSPPVRTYPPPEHLKGMDTVALTDFLGKPGFRRTDAPAEIWHYTGSGCTLYVFLYRNGDRGSLKVDYVEMRGSGGKSFNSKACFASVIESGGGASTG